MYQKVHLCISVINSINRNEQMAEFTITCGKCMTYLATVSDFNLSGPFLLGNIPLDIIFIRFPNNDLLVDIKTRTIKCMQHKLIIY